MLIPQKQGFGLTINDEFYTYEQFLRAIDDGLFSIEKSWKNTRMRCGMEYM